MAVNQSRRWVQIFAGFLLAGVALLAGGCASIVHGGYRQLDLKTTPSQADVVVTKAGSGEVVTEGRTPLSVALKPKKGYFSGQAYEVAISKPGYADVRYQVTPTLSGWYWGNILFGGLVGMLAVDPLTGAMWNLKAPQDTVALRQIDGGRDPMAAEEAAPAPAGPRVKRPAVRTKRASGPSSAPAAGVRAAPPGEALPAAENDAALYDQTYASYQRVLERYAAAKERLAGNPADVDLQDQVRLLESVRTGMRAALNEIARRNSWTEAGR